MKSYFAYIRVSTTRQVYMDGCRARLKPPSHSVAHAPETGSPRTGFNGLDGYKGQMSFMEMDGLRGGGGRVVGRAGRTGSGSQRLGSFLTPSGEPGLIPLPHSAGSTVRLETSQDFGPERAGEPARESSQERIPCPLAGGRSEGFGVTQERQVGTGTTLQCGTGSVLTWSRGFRCMALEFA
jgi:hypothetical protein